MKSIMPVLRLMAYHVLGAVNWGLDRTSPYAARLIVRRHELANPRWKK